MIGRHSTVSAGTAMLMAAESVMNAVNDALGRIGAGYLQMPATPEKVWRALREAGWRPREEPEGEALRAASARIP